MKVSYKDFIHPQDDAARRELESVPGFNLLVKWFLKFGLEQFLHGYFMANYIRLSKTQLPEIYNLLPPVAEKFGIEEPEFYLQMNPTPNAYTTGDERRFIVVTSGLLEHITDVKERESIIAHECGHIVCRHVFYMTMARMLSMAGFSFGITSALVAPLDLAFKYWSRRCELSADRASAVYLGEVNPAMQALLRITGGPQQFTKDLNIEEYAAQSQAYYALQKDSKWHKLLQSYAVMNQGHPFSAVRIQELIKWCDSDKYRRLCKSWEEGLDMFVCDKCRKLVSKNDRFCAHCGNPIV